MIGIVLVTKVCFDEIRSNDAAAAARNRPCHSNVVIT